MNRTHNMHHQRSISALYLAVIYPVLTPIPGTLLFAPGSRERLLSYWVSSPLSTLVSCCQDETKFIHSLITRTCVALRVASASAGAVPVCTVLVHTGRQALLLLVGG